MASTSSFAAFAAALNQSNAQPVASILDAQTGLALLFAEACSSRAASALSGMGAGASAVGLLESDNNRSTAAVSAIASGDGIGAMLEDDGDDGETWELEEQTWNLIHLLYAERLSRASSDPSSSKKGSNDYETPFTIAQDLFDKDGPLSELRIIRDWLSSSLVCIHPVEVRKGYWPFTKNRLRNDKRTSSSGRSGAVPGRGGLGKAGITGKGIRALDPDATTRDTTSALELEDGIYEKALNRTLFEYARAGQLDAALDLARQSDRSWRAASLRGALLYWRRGLDDTQELTEPMGNENRALWKAVCRNICARQSLEDEYEKALYGALSGDLRSVLHVSKSWESQLWAHVNARLEASIDAKLDARAGWWSQNAGSTFTGTLEAGAVKLVELSIPNAGVENNAVLGGSTDTRTNSKPLTVAEELRTVFARLGQMEQHSIQEQSNHPFRIVQKAVILDEVSELLIHVEPKLAEMRVTAAPQQYARLVRFFAHLILFLRLLRLERPPPDVVCNSILRAYVEILQSQGEDDLVALYASSLGPESATESYAHYLKGKSKFDLPTEAVFRIYMYVLMRFHPCSCSVVMDVNEPQEHRRAALRKAEEHHLDVAAVARTTVAMIFDEVFPSIPSLSDFAITSFEAGLSLGEERLIRAIDWLTFYPATHFDALVQTNKLMRLFLSSGKVHAARTLLFQMPANIVGQLETISEAKPDEAIEFVHWRSFFEALNVHLQYLEVWSKRPAAPSARTRVSKVDTHDWKVALSDVVESARQGIVDVLEMDWLKIEAQTDLSVAPVLTIDDERRWMELARIRQTYVPELVFRVHHMLFDTIDDLPA